MPHDPIAFDAATAGLAPTPLAGWGASRPDGRRLGADTYQLTLDGAPFPVVSGELIAQRYPADEWEDALRGLRDAGCTMVSSYVFWGLVEPRAGEFDFTGSNDIRRFAELCAEVGLLFAPRIGPFNNSEFLLGGLPPWLYGLPLVERSNDPLYLDLVRRYFDRVAEQFDGLYWADGGPIVLVQLENELAHAPNDWRTLFGYTATDHRGPEDGREYARHMTTLRESAVAAGITPPFFAMTAWGLPDEVPLEGYIPTYGAYLDLHPQPGDNHVLTTFQGGEYPYRGQLPTAFCELGTGSPTRAAYRSMTPAGSMLTTAVTRFGSVESLFLGYYLYHGGTNPVRGDGFGWTTKEPEFPLRSYDFWAPLSEFGERRESFHRALPFNLLVREFGVDLGSTQVVEPADPVLDPTEDRLRTILRADAEGGFVFYANYGNTVPLSDRPDVRFAVRLADRELSFPRRSTLRIPSGAAGAFPVGLPLGGGLRLLSATAQPLARLSSDGVPVVLFHAPAGAEAEYVLADVAPGEVSPAGDGPDAGAGAIAVHAEADGTTVIVRVDGAVSFDVATGAGHVRVVTVPTGQAEHSGFVASDAERILVTADAELSQLGDSLLVSRIVHLGTPSAAVALGRPGIAADLPLTLPAAGATSPVTVRTLGPGRALLTATDPSADLDDLWLDLAYTGDLVRLFDAGTGILVGDDFSRGIPWRLRLGRFAGQLRGAGLQVRVEPVSTRVEVDNAEGILLDHAEQAVGEARIDELRFLQRVAVTVAVAEVLGGAAGGGAL